jgi:hypothetical protein
MKDDVNVEVPNGTPKTLIPSNGGGKLRWGLKTLKGILSFATKKSMTKCNKSLHN